MVKLCLLLFVRIHFMRDDINFVLDNKKSDDEIFCLQKFFQSSKDVN
jgi:hypothetical protein